MPKRTTLKEIAKRLNVSVSTVSRALNDQVYVKQSTRARILAAIEEMDYTPNEVARSLKTNTTKTIGIIVPDICETFFGNVIKGIDEVVSKKGYSVMVSDTNESKTRERNYLDLMYQKSVDALVLATVDLKGKKVLRFLDSHVPVIFIDNIPSIDREISYITIDNKEASHQAVDHLRKHGHRDIAAIFGSVDETTGFDRWQGFIDACRASDIPVNEQLIQYGNYKEDDGYALMSRLIANRGLQPFTAVYITSENMTLGAMKAIRDANLSVPGDISILGFDIHDNGRLINPTITSVRQPEKKIGDLAGSLLIQNLNGGKNKNEQLLVKPYLELGISVKKI